MSYLLIAKGGVYVTSGTVMAREGPTREYVKESNESNEGRVILTRPQARQPRAQ